MITIVIVIMIIIIINEFAKLKEFPSSINKRRYVKIFLLAKFSLLNFSIIFAEQTDLKEKM